MSEYEITPNDREPSGKHAGPPAESTEAELLRRLHEAETKVQEAYRRGAATMQEHIARYIGDQWPGLSPKIPDAVRLLPVPASDPRTGICVKCAAPAQDHVTIGGGHLCPTGPLAERVRRTEQTTAHHQQILAELVERVQTLETENTSE